MIKKRASIVDLPIDYVSLETFPSVLANLAKKKRAKPLLVTYLNAHNFNLAQKNERYRRILRGADLVYTDGWGVVLAARLFGYRLPGRLTAKDFFYEFCQIAEEKQMSLFFLGGSQSVIRKTSEILKKRFPKLKIRGAQNGFFSQGQEGAILLKINRTKPDFLIIGMGSPKQELWLAKNLPRLKIKVSWCVGGLFNYISGETTSCPGWLGDFGFEWLFRMLVEPKRLWRRYLIGGPEFLFQIIRLKLNS